MVTFTCPECLRTLSVKEGLEGKKVKCPGCQQLTAVPAPVAAGCFGREPLTLPTEVQPDTSLRPDHTRTLGPDGLMFTRVTDLLAPPQTDGELGRLGKYRVLEVLGQGGMGVVFKAEDPLLKRTVAVKAMLPALTDGARAGRRFLREAQAMAALEHDHVVRIYQVDEDRGVPFLAMEFLKGESLHDRLGRLGRLPVEEALRVGREIARGLAAAQEKGLIHRDVKPSNVWLEAGTGRVKLLDFGLARAAARDAGLTQEGAIIGTPAYMSPEQARGEAVDSRSDLFSLGVVIYRMCCGRPPFEGKDPVSALLAVATEEPTPPSALTPGLPAGLSELTLKLLRKNPDRRPDSADEVAAALQTIERELATRAEAARAAAAWRRRIPVLAAAAVLLVGLVGTALMGAGLIRFGTDLGDVVIATDDPDFAFSRGKDGGLVLEDRKTRRTYDVKVVRQAGDEYELEVTDAGADLSFKTKTFTLKRGETVALKAWFERKEAPAKPPPEEAWLKQVAALAPEDQVKAVAAKLKERNPGFDGQVTHAVADGVVTELTFATDDVTDISPVRALPGLLVLNCHGSDRGLGKLASLEPLRGMKIRSLNCGWTRVSDLSPLKDTNLTNLLCATTPVSDLSPLKGLKLTALNCSETQVSDLTPLKDQRLTGLWCFGTRVTDLSPLRGLPLGDLRCDFKPERDAEILRSIKTLETINGKPAAEFWKEVDPAPKP